MPQTQQSSADRVYQTAKEMAVAFRILPGQRINEGALAKELEASRTPVREALNRLVAERLLEFRPGKGFFCRDLEPKEIFDLYEIRTVLEVAAVELACARAGDDQLAELDGELRTHGLEVSSLSLGERVERDEQFHQGLARLSGNTALAQQLTGINERIRFVRWLDMETRTAGTKREHLEIMTAMLGRDPQRAGEIMRHHIAKRLDQITETLRIGYGRLYVTEQQGLDRRVPEDAGITDPGRMLK